MPLPLPSSLWGRGWGWGPHLLRFLLNLRNVSASLARCPNFPPFFAAARNLATGIDFPFFAPNCRRSAPGRLIAFLIHFFFLLFAITPHTSPNTRNRLHRIAPFALMVQSPSRT